MGFLQLIADFMQNLLYFPLRAVQAVRRWREQRHLLQRAGHEVSMLGKDATGVKGFFQRLGRVVLWLLLLAVAVLFFWLLIFLNDWFDLPRLLGGPWPWLRPYWLPLLVVLFTGTCVLAFRLWRMLGPEKEIEAHADIDQAWLEATSALVQAGVNLREAPLFLVLGKTAAPLDAFFAGSRVSWIVRQAPLRIDAPFQVYASRQGIFVAVSDVTMLGAVADRLARATPLEENLPPPQASVFHEGAPAAEPVPSQEEAAVEAPADPLASPNLLQEAPASAPQDLLASYTMAEAQPTLEERNARQSRSRWRPLAAADRNRIERRTEYLARLIARHRRPYCSLNGIVAIIPIQTLANAEEANEIAGAIETDLQFVREAAQTRCPLWIAVSDLETVPGFDAMFASLDAERRLRLLGRDFPLYPDINPREWPGLAELAVRSFLTSVATLTLKIFQVESPEVPASVATGHNCRLFEFLQALRQRQDGLEKVIARTLAQEAPQGMYFGGFYLAATGVDPKADQAFLPGLFRLLADHQNEVSWTPEAIAEEADYQRWTIFGYAAMAVFCLLLVLLGFWRWQSVA